MKSRIFEVQFSVPPGVGEKAWRINKLAMVVTTDAGEAIALVKERDPDADIWQCLHRGGTGYLIIDPRMREA